MVGVIHVYVETVFGFYVSCCFFFHCSVGCFSMIVWTPVLSVLHLFSATEHVSHGKAL